MAQRKRAMKRRKWDAKTKANIVLQGIKGRPVSEICIEHQITQSEYYRWKDQFLSNMPMLFENRDRKETALKQENDRLKKMVGELNLELKKSEWSD
jgi:transposase-like protein